jgi:membrane protein implicated in regulation of membrane protease activity
MLVEFFSQLGPWNWMALGFVLLILEILVPGVFLLWIGLAALIVGGLSLLLWDASFWAWQLQVVLFLALSIACALIGKKIMGNRGDVTDQPLLNQRGAQLIGRIATLTEPIVDGRGRVKIGDTTEIKEASKQLTPVLEASQLGERDVPDFIEADHSKMTAKFTRIPVLSDVPFAVQMEPHLIVEFYSR